MAFGINTGPNRSELVARLLQQQAQRRQPIQSVGEGFTRLGSELVNALVERRGIRRRERQEEEVRDNLAKALGGDTAALGALTGQNPSLGLQLLNLQGQQSARQSAIDARDREISLRQAADAQKRVEAQRRAEQEAVEAERQAAKDAEAQRIAAERLALDQRRADAAERQASPEFQAEVAEARSGAQRAAQRPQRVEGLRSSIAEVTDTRRLVEDLINAPGREAATGFSATFPTWPGGEAADFESRLDTLKARLTFNQLSDLRKRGGTLGAVSERELAALEAATDSLNLGQSEEQFLENLRRIDDRLQRLEFGLGDQLALEELPAGSAVVGINRFRLPDGTIVERE